VDFLLKALDRLGIFGFMTVFSLLVTLPVEFIMRHLMFAQPDSAWLSTSFWALYLFNLFLFFLIGAALRRNQRHRKELSLLRNAFEVSHDVYFLIDKNAHFVKANLAAQQETGFSISELQGMRFNQIDKVYPPINWGETWKKLRKNGALYFESQHERKDQSKYRVEVKGKLITYQDEEYLLALVKNIEKKKKHDEFLQSERQKFELAIEGSQDGLWDWNIETNDVIFSDRFIELLGYEPAEYKPSSEFWVEHIHPEDVLSAKQAINKHLTGQTEFFESRHRLLCKDGHWKWVQERGKALFNKEGEAVRFVGFMTDISEQIRHEEALQRSAKHDLLTDLPNRLMLNQLLNSLMTRSERNESLLAVVYVDLDKLQLINDTHGKNVGDIVLTSVAQRMKKTIRTHDLVSRVGGDEFVVVLTDFFDKKDIFPLINRLLKDISKDIEANHDGKALTLGVTASIGVSFYPQKNTIGFDALIRQADQAMYKAKTAGKNTFRLFDAEESAAMQAQIDKVNRIKTALENDELVLHYQPKVEMDTGKVLGFEALVRWKDPRHGIIYPDVFLPLINDNAGLMLQLGEWVFDNALKQLDIWNKSGHSLTLGINVSAHELYRKSILHYLSELMSKYDSVDPKQLELEILETHALEDSDSVISIIRECEDIGIKVSLDDFGTGYSTLSYLKNLPVSALKIDRGFVADMLHDNASLSIIEAALGLAQAFRCETVAEGVEDLDQGVMLLKLGCRMAQGYAISEAMPAEDVDEWLSNWKGIKAWQGIHAIEAEHRDILYAEHSHRNWMKSIDRHIQSPESHPLPNLDPSCCQFGQWLTHKAVETFDAKDLEKITHEYHKLYELAQRLNAPLSYDEVEELRLKMKSKQKGIVTQLNYLTSLISV